MSNTRRTIVIIIAALLVFSGFVLARFPASHALALASRFSQGMLTANNVSGTVWQGKADNIYLSYFNQTLDLGRTQWQLAFWPLLLAKLDIALEAKNGKQYIQTHAVASVNRLQLKDTQITMDVARLMQFYPVPIDARGSIELLLQDAQLTNSGVEQIAGNVVFKEMAFTFQKAVDLGSYGARLSMDGDDVKADFSDLDASMVVAGYVKGNLTPGRYETDMTIKTTEKTDDWIIQSLPMLAKQQEDGSFRLQQSGHF